MANTLTIHLDGVCVHLGEDSGVTLPSGVRHRVVYPAGIPPYITGVNAHNPTIKIEETDPPNVVLPEQPLSEQIVTVSTAGATTSGFDSHACCIPHLTDRFPWLVLDPEKVRGNSISEPPGLPIDGFAFIDLEVGSLYPRFHEGAADSRVLIDYDENTTSVTVTITPPLGGVGTFPVSLPATVTINSHADDHHVLDYYVTFLVASLPPTEPPDVKEEVDRVINFVNVCLGGEGDAGCSNSQFP